MAIHKFQTEVNQLLHLIIHSLYSHKEIFLRELVSNASDALDKLKYLTLTDDRYRKLEFDPRIDIEFDQKNRKTLTISDTGIGMNAEELVENLGTIAGSGTRNFLEMMSGREKADANLIGQFGVGFYSAFMVSDKIEVISRKAGEDRAYKWISDGKNDFEVKDSDRKQNGTTVICYLNEEGKEYAQRWQIEGVVRKYSNHIPFPIFLHYEESSFEGEGKNRKETKEKKVEQINAASAFWKRPKSELTEEDYNEFYKTIAHDSDDPLLTIHTHAEGTLEYSTLFYVPKKAPIDMFYVNYRPGVKLYVKRVFITDEDKELLPSYLRFIRGIIDSEDLPLNVSREMLQKNRVLSNIKNASVKKILGEFEELSKEEEKYEQFYREYRIPLKEGLYQDFGNREKLLELMRFKSTTVDGLSSLAEYKNRMKPDQKGIYYITGSDEATLRESPLLEIYKKQGIEVLIMDDEIDEIVMSVIGTYKDISLKSVNRSGTSEDFESDETKSEDVQSILDKIKEALQDAVKDVRVSSRLSESPACIVSDEFDPTLGMQRIMKALGQGNGNEVKPILEVNPSHKIVKKLKEITDRALIEDISWVLLNQALMIEGAEVKNPALFVKRVNRLLARAL